MCIHGVIVFEDRVLKLLCEERLPLFLYDTGVLRKRALMACSVLDACYFPIKACPEVGMVKAAVDIGCGLDLCSSGDVSIAESIGCQGTRWSFTSPHVNEELLHRLLLGGGLFDADSVEQALLWRSVGGEECGLRVATSDADSPYGIKFGIPIREFGECLSRADGCGLRITGVHIHENHVLRSPMEMSDRLAATLEKLPSGVLATIHYVNIGGGWPKRSGLPVPIEEIGPALAALRLRLVRLGFQGILAGEPGEWVSGPCGLLASRVSAIKSHPLIPSRKILIQDTSTPIPCRPSDAPFWLIRDGHRVEDTAIGRFDVFGSANTGSDMIGIGLRLPRPSIGDILVSSVQGAYMRSLIGSFNERQIPDVRTI